MPAVGIEDDILMRLQQGSTPSQLVAGGFRKSTVYKVAEALRSLRAPAPVSLVAVQLQPDRARYLPGEVAQLTFVVTNNSGVDLYVFQVGVRPEWLDASEWIPTVLRKLLGAGDSLTVRFTIPIPSHLDLGEKELFVGIQGQWVGPQSASPSNEMMWTHALIICVQRPLTGASVFIAHSVADMSLVSRLESTLDDNGIRPLLAGPDVPVQAMDQADFVVGILTSQLRLDAVLGEIAHASSQGKEMLLLRDESLSHLVPAEYASLGWTDVDFSRRGASVVVNLVASLNETLSRRVVARKKEQDDTLGAILLGLAALAAGIAIGKGLSG
jgi:hypothetical protein